MLKAGDAAKSDQQFSSYSQIAYAKITKWTLKNEMKINENKINARKCGNCDALQLESARAALIETPIPSLNFAVGQPIRSCLRAL